MSNPYASQQRTQLENAAPQHAEGWALVETARRLEAAKASATDTDAVLAAVRLNWRIWTIIQAELIDPACTIPREIRENLINLSNFIDKRSAELIGNPSDPGKLDVLININRQIGAGLLESAGETQQPSQAEAPQAANAPQQPAPGAPPDRSDAARPAIARSGTATAASPQRSSTGGTTSTEA